MPGRMEFSFGLGKAAAPRPRRHTEAMRILVLGDFGARGDSKRSVAPESPASLRPRRVDVDNLEALLATLAPTLHLTLDVPSHAELSVTFSALEDFHPDSLYARLSVFEPLRALRRQLQNPATFAAAAEEVRRLAQAPALPVPEPETPAPAVEADAATLERLLGRQPTGAERHAGEPHGIERLIQGIVAPHVVPDEEPYADVYLSAVDQASAELMRALIHHPKFRALEAAWRSLHGLVTGLETSEELQLYLLDVSKQALLADVQAAGDDLQRTELYRGLVERGVDVPGGEPWSLLVGNFDFGADPQDIALLAVLGAIGRQAGGPFLAGAALGLLGCPSVTDLPEPQAWAPLQDAAGQSWQALRRSGLAPWIGLALPRVLLRQPYGEGSEEIDAFPFEEMPPGGNHATFLWGNPAFACSQLIAQAYQERGWSMAPGDVLDLDELPAYTYTAEGESQLLPCAQVYMSERSAEAVLARGLMPVLSYRNRNAVRIMRFQSIADPLTPLSGPWK